MPPKIKDNECGLPGNPHDWYKPRPTDHRKSSQHCTLCGRRREIGFNPSTGKEETRYLP